ncbi:ferritin-like domain-containing protein [candidate division KSB1 bacterium]|nr:ferritin-like domain-containing protein [candidate division KSB1 bacterium]
MAVDVLFDILNEAIELEKMAMGYYQSVSEQSSDEKMKTFWRSMAVQEGEHLQYWKSLIELTEAGRIRDVFDYPTRVLSELRSISKQVEETIKNIQYDDREQLFLTAYRLEFYMLHPAFEALFHLMKQETGNQSPEEGYARHLQNLFSELGDLGQKNSAFQLIADLVQQVFASNRQAAEQLAQVKELRGLLPVCMHCKNVRDDEGYWQKIEKYIGDRAEVEFSHGICEDCMVKYYPEIAEDIKNAGE